MEKALTSIAESSGISGPLIVILLVSVGWLGRRLIQTNEARIEDAKAIPEIIKAHMDDQKS